MYSFAQRMEGLKASEIREFLKVAQRPEVISFAGGMPAPELFPVSHVAAACQAVLEENGSASLQYATTEGYLPMRQQIVERMKYKNAIESDTDHVIILSGSQEGLSLAAETFLDKDDVVLMESPTFLGAINAFKTTQAKCMAVPTDDEGMIIEDLERMLSTTERVKLIYVIPDSQNPTGKTWSLERRKAFMKVVEKYRVPVVEDNPYGELRYSGSAVPSLKSLDEDNLVIYLGTFSKIFVPGFRLSWVCADTAILEKFNILKQATTLQASTFCMMVASKWIELFDLDAHVAGLCETYRRRKDLMIDVLKKRLPASCRFTDPEGGLFTWIELPEGIDTRELSQEALEEKVAFVPGAAFFPEGGHGNTLRLNYSNMDDERIVEGTERLCRLICRQPGSEV